MSRRLREKDGCERDAPRRNAGTDTRRAGQCAYFGRYTYKLLRLNGTPQQRGCHHDARCSHDCDQTLGQEYVCADRKGYY